MQFTCANKYLICPKNFDMENPVVELKNILPGQIFEGDSSQSKIVFLLKGKVFYTTGIFKDLPLAEKHIMFMPPDCKYCFRAKEEEVQFLFFRLYNKIQFCECYLLESLASQIKEKDIHKTIASPSQPPLLKINKEIESYVSNLLLYMSLGLNCKFFFDLKIREFFYLLRAFYPKKELALFFANIISSDSSFSHYITYNHHKYLSVQAMAKDMNIALSSFEKRFKKAFGLSPYKWMNQQKAIKIFNALCTEETPIKEMHLRFGFSSRTAFDTFCKKELSETPAKIRKKMRSGENEDK